MPHKTRYQRQIEARKRALLELASQLSLHPASSIYNAAFRMHKDALESLLDNPPVKKKRPGVIKPRP